MASEMETGWGNSILGVLTPKLYVALTGTSSLISGLILVFEWWYFRQYGTSFIEQLSLSQLGPWLGDREPPPPPVHLEYKINRNPLALLRGAEYGRLWTAAKKPPLTQYDMNLTAGELLSAFGLAGTAPLDEVDAALAAAWRERSGTTRVSMARGALARRPQCAVALFLLAEEEAPTVVAAERGMRAAMRAAEASLRAGGPRRDTAVVVLARRRLAMCARRLGRLRDAARMFRDLVRDAPAALQSYSVHENLLELLLEQRAYADAAALVARCEEAGAPDSAALLYTDALLRARGPQTDPASADAMRRAIRYNPYVPAYLLEMRAMTLPPEHVLRRGDSEALAYAFMHLRHWRAAGAQPLRLLQQAAGSEPAPPRPQRVDRELLPPHHAPPPAPLSPLPPAVAALCAVLALLTVAVHHAPENALALPLPPDPRALLRLLADV